MCYFYICLFIHLCFLCQLKETLAKVPPNHVGKPLLKKSLGPAHWVSSDHLWSEFARNHPAIL